MLACYAILTLYMCNDNLAVECDNFQGCKNKVVLHVEPLLFIHFWLNGLGKY